MYMHGVCVWVCVRRLRDDWCVLTVTSHTVWTPLPLPGHRVLSSCIHVTSSLTFLPSPLLITSDGQFPLKRGQIYCATECAEGFLGRWARTAEMERRKEDNEDKLGSWSSSGITRDFFQAHGFKSLRAEQFFRFHSLIYGSDVEAARCHIIFENSGKVCSSIPWSNLLSKLHSCHYQLSSLENI